VRWIWRALTRRLLLKFIALLCAVVLWVYAWSTTSSVRSIPATVSLSVPPNLKASVVTPGEMLYPAWHVPVRVTVRGPAGPVRSLQPTDLHAVLPMPETHPTGDARVKLQSTVFAVPQGVVIVRVEPPELLVRVSSERDKASPDR